VQNRKSGTTRFGKSRFLWEVVVTHINQPNATYKIIWTADYLPIAFFIPRELVNQATETFKSDHYYKTMTYMETACFHALRGDFQN